MGFFDIPTVKRNPTGWLALILGILLGGIGTIIIGVMEKQKAVWQLGIIQLVVTIVTFGIGGIWALVWGILVFVRSTPDAPMAFTPTPTPAAKAPAAAPAKKAAAKSAPKKAAAKKSAKKA
jgi:hypothetical protein